MRRKSLLTRLRNAPGQLRWLVVRAARSAVGLDTALDTEDRRVLEGTVLAWLAERPEYRRVLFVGCDWYTRAYEKLFAEREYVTVERDPRRRRWGAARHVTASVVDLGAHFAPASLDAIVMNGVLGWGLDDPAEAEAALAACAEALAPGGLLVLGWNDIPEKRVLQPEQSASLQGLESFALPPLGVSRHLCPGRARHTYDFFRKPRG